MLTRPYFKLVPSIYQMEVFEFQDGDPTYQRTRPDGVVVPMGISLAKLQQRLGGEEGNFPSPSGETYHISLAPWEGKDREKTFLQMTFHATPLFPIDMPPELRPSPSSLPPTRPQRETPSPSTVPEVSDASSASSIPQRMSSSRASSSANFISCSDVRREHRIKVQQSRNPETGVTIEALLRLPETVMTEIHCPVCDAPIKLCESLAEHLQQGIEWWGNESKVQMIFEHPMDIEETRTESADSPFVVHRYRRYTPVSLPARQKDPDIELSIVQKIHNHLVVLTADSGETTAQALLALPEAKQTQLSCPLCDEKLPVEEPFEKYIRILADDAEDDTAHIQWSISHPSDSAETKVPSKEDAICATRHASDDEFVQKRYEGYAGFVVRKKRLS